MTREEAIKALKEMIEYEWDTYKTKTAKVYVEALDMAIKALEEQEPKTGHWIRWYEKISYENSTEYNPHCKCSECNTEYDPHTSQFIKYCNVCGAKMESEEEK